MKYPEDFLNKVIQGDCLEVMKQMPDKCVDLVLTDPPYGINVGTPIKGERERVTSRPLELKGLASPKVIGDLMILKSPQEIILVRWYE